jgi:hypothetical protein
MTGLPLGLIVEGAVAVLLVLTIGYCVILNARLKRLHADRDELKKMAVEIIHATELANRAITGLKETAKDCDEALTSRLEEADRFSVELARHVNAGNSVLTRIAQITEVVRAEREQREQSSQVQENRSRLALEQLDRHQQSREAAA